MLYACRPKLLDGYSFSFALVDPTAARYAAWETVRGEGFDDEGALCDVAGQAPSAQALELRVQLPAVASMYQIRIHPQTTTLSLTRAGTGRRKASRMNAVRRASDCTPQGGAVESAEALRRRIAWRGSKQASR